MSGESAATWTRRHLLGFGLGGLALPELLRASTTAGSGGFGKAKRCLLLFLWGVA